MKRLLIFDIDGTLLQSTSLQMSCLRQALEFIFANHFLRWGEREATFTTDSGILFEISQEILGRSPSRDEEARFKSAFIAAVERSLAEGNCLSATPGANQALMLAGNAVSIATGGFQVVSELKMKSVALPFEGIPAAFAEDGFTKEKVLEIALARAESQVATRFDEVFYFADASYDVRAARSLGFKFVGVGDSVRRKRLMDCGAELTVPDLTVINDLFLPETPGVEFRRLS